MQSQQEFTEELKKQSVILADPPSTNETLYIARTKKSKLTVSINSKCNKFRIQN